MSRRSALQATLRSRRFWLWQISGAFIYAIPAVIRFATGSMIMPVLNFPGFWIGYFIPGNFLEKLLVNAFFPGGAGGVAGEIFFQKYRGNAANWTTLHLNRLAGALLQTAAWSAFQFSGYYLLIMGPYGSNIFESAMVFPINFVLASLSVFTPDVLAFVKFILAK